jgi:hypothetical protein
MEAGRLRHGVRATMMTVAACCLLLAASGCDAPPARAAQAPAATTTWRTLGQWTGTGSRQTESFDVVTGALRLQWETRAVPGSTGGAARFRVWLYSAISGRPLQLVAEADGPGAGTAHVADDPRVSYLLIEADGVTWSAALHESTASSARR